MSDDEDGDEAGAFVRLTLDALEVAVEGKPGDSLTSVEETAERRLEHAVEQATALEEGDMGGFR